MNSVLKTHNLEYEGMITLTPLSPPDGSTNTKPVEWSAEVPVIESQLIFLFVLPPFSWPWLMCSWPRVDRFLAGEGLGGFGGRAGLLGSESFELLGPFMWNFMGDVPPATCTIWCPHQFSRRQNNSVLRSKTSDRGKRNLSTKQHSLQTREPWA